MFAWQFAKMLYQADELGLTRFVTMQNHYNLIYREEEREMMPLCRAEGIGVIPWSPLARGFLAGNRRKEDFGETVRSKTDEYAHGMYYQPSDFAVVDRVGEVARARGVPNAQVALAWILQQPGVTAPIVGASKMQHLEDAVAALSMKLDERGIEGAGGAVSAASGAGAFVMIGVIPVEAYTEFMAVVPTIPLVSPDEYLTSGYHPDMEYVDGVLVERDCANHCT